MARQDRPALAVSPRRKAAIISMCHSPVPGRIATSHHRALKGLEDMIDVSVTHWLMRENGWNFAPGEGVIADP